MDRAEEDRILAAANEIRGRIFREAETQWATTPDVEKQRPWPRCHNLECNRTLVCRELVDADARCEGWDF